MNSATDSTKSRPASSGRAASAATPGTESETKSRSTMPSAKARGASPAKTPCAAKAPTPVAPASRHKRAASISVPPVQTTSSTMRAIRPPTSPTSERAQVRPEERDLSTQATGTSCRSLRPNSRANRTARFTPPESGDTTTMRRVRCATRSACQARKPVASIECIGTRNAFSSAAG